MVLRSVSKRTANGGWVEVALHASASGDAIAVNQEADEILLWPVQILKASQGQKK
jgi:hypothetical protein